MKRIYVNLVRTCISAIVIVSLLACSEGVIYLDDENIPFDPGNATEGLKDFFVTPIKDSIIAIGDGYKTATVSASEAVDALDDIGGALSTSSVHSSATDPGSNQNIQKFDLAVSDLQSCDAYNGLSGTNDARFAGVVDIISLSEGFAWNSDRRIPLSFAGEFSYISSFIHSCAFEQALAKVGRIIDIETLDDTGNTYIVSDDAGAYIKATVSIDTQLFSGRSLQIMDLKKSTIASFNEPMPEGVNRLQFSRAFQSAAIDQQEQVDNLQMSVVHEVVIDRASTDQSSDPGVNTLGESGNYGALAMQQKFTLVVSDSNSQWQGVSFFASYKYDARCQPARVAGDIDFSRYQLTASKSSADLVCADNRQPDRPIIDAFGDEIALRDAPTDSALYMAVTDKRYGSYTYRVICSGGHKVDDGYYDISECATDDMQVEVEYYDAQGRGDTSSKTRQLIDKEFGDEIRVIRSQMDDYSRGKQFPADISRFAELQGNFSDNDGRIDNENLTSKEYASEQQRAILDAPSYLRANRLHTSIRLSWAPVTGATYYKVFRNTKNTINGATKLVDSLPTTFDDYTYLTETHYYYWVKACNAFGCTDSFSSVANIYSGSVLQPDVPQNLSATQESGKSVSLAWDRVNTAHYYLVYFNETNNFSTAKKVGRTVLPSYIDRGLTHRVQYFYWVQGCYNAACSEPSTLATITLVSEPPKNLRVSNVTDNSLLLHWNLVRDYASYVIYRSKDGADSVDPEQIGVSSSSVYGDYRLSPGASYTYWVKACDSTMSDCTDLSVPLRVTMTPSVPSNVHVLLESSTSASANWSPTAGSSYYNLELFADSNGHNVKSGERVMTETRVNIDTLNPSSTYFVRVNGCNDAGCSPFSSLSQFETPAISAPNRLQSSIAGTSVRLRWNSVRAVRYYQLYRHTENNITSAVAFTQIEDPSATTYTDLTATPGTAYYYWIVACNDNACSDYSPVARAKPLYYPLNDTGVGGFFDADPEYVKDSCENANQDCAQGRDYKSRTNALDKTGGGIAGFDFTRLSAEGNEYTGNGRFDASPWQCIRDNYTGLTWEVKQTRSSNRRLNYLAESVEKLLLNSQEYRWSNGAVSSEDGDDETRSWTNLIDAANSANLCGFSDWRIPNVSELLSIVDFDNTPTIDTAYFPNVSGNEVFWTSQVKTDDSDKAWLFDFEDGSFMTEAYKDDDISAHVRLVRGDKPIAATSLHADKEQSVNSNITNDWPNARYTNNGDGTITDTYTGLMWTQCPIGEQGCGYTDTGVFNWKSALLAADQLNRGDYNNWRIPNIKELQSLVAFDRYNTAVNKTHFPWDNDLVLWSSTPVPDETAVYGYNMADASPQTLSIEDDDNSYHVIAVRNAD